MELELIFYHSSYVHTLKLDFYGTTVENKLHENVYSIIYTKGKSIILNVLFISIITLKKYEMTFQDIFKKYIYTLQTKS